MADEKAISQSGLSYFWSKIKPILGGKQDKLTGTTGQVVGFDAQGNAVAQEATSGVVMKVWTTGDMS